MQKYKSTGLYYETTYNYDNIHEYMVRLSTLLLVLSTSPRLAFH